MPNLGLKRVELCQKAIAPQAVVAVQQLPDGGGLAGRQQQARERVAVGGKAVQVGTGVAVEARQEQAAGAALHLAAVLSRQGDEVQLELAAAALQAPQRLLGHVQVALGVGNDGLVAAQRQPVQDGVNLGGGAHVGGLDKHTPPVERQQPVLRLLAAETAVHHVLARKAELDGGGVASKELAETGAEAVGTVAGKILHDVRREQHAAHATRLQPAAGGVGGRAVGHPVVHAGEQVGVHVGHALQQAELRKGLAAGKEIEHDGLGICAGRGVFPRPACLTCLAEP